MSLVEWSDDLLIGNDVIDGQHKIFVEMINSLYDGITGNNGITVFESIIDLQQHTIYHLAEEEIYMIKNDYNCYKEHKAHHDILRKQVRELDALISEESIESKTILLHDMIDWLINHKMMYDIHLQHA